MSDISERLGRLSTEKRALLLRQLQRKKEEGDRPQLQRRHQESNSYPLSFGQQRLWFLDQLEPGSTVYNMPLAMRLRGMLDIKALQSSLTALMQRHEILRVTFHAGEEQPVQIIAPLQDFHLPLIQLNAVAAEQRESHMQQLVQQELQRPFDLEHGPLVRAVLLQLHPDEYGLLLTVHHIVSDGWSMDVLMREIALLYNAFAAGRPSPLPALPVQYTDFALWQREWLQGQVLEEQIAYWTQQLRGGTPLQLSTDHPRPLVQSFWGTHLRRLLPKALNEQLKHLSQRADVTLFMTLLAAFQVLLSRYTGQSDISVGTPIANRSYAEIEGLIGFFVNTLVMRTDLSGNPTFLEVLSRVRKVCLGAYAHQDVPFEKLVEVLHPERDLSRSPLFQVMFSVQQASQATQTTQTPRTQSLHNLALTNLGGESGISKFELTVTLMDTEQGLHCSVEYNTDLFASETIERLIGHLQTLLEGIVAHPEQHVYDVPLLTPAENVQMLHAWNTPSTPVTTERNFHQLFAQQVAQTPEQIAVTMQDACLTYAALNQRAAQLAWYLHQQGVPAGTLIGLCVERSLEMIVAILAILKAGATFVPLDPTYPEQRLTFMMDDARLSTVLTQQHLLPKLPRQPQTVICLDTDWDTIAQAERVETLHPAYPESAAYVIYTSGSTGQPKGVLVPHRGLCNLVEAQKHVFDLLPSDRILQFAALSFDASVWEIGMALYAGATLCLAQQEDLLPGQDLVDLLQEQAITCVTLPPSALSALSPLHLPALGTIISAGEACSIPLIQQWAAGRRFYNAYGPTETTVCATITLCDAESSVVTIGRPLLNAQVYLLDAHLHLVPVGQIGEMYLGGENIALGYLHRPELTAERFIANPFSAPGQPGARLYKSGDLARYRPDGSIECLGRADSQVKLRGYRIELGEIEEALKTHPLVSDGAVLVRQNANGEQFLMGYVSSRYQEPVTASEVREYLQAQLPKHMVPARVIVMESLPVTSNGKVDRQLLATFEAEAIQPSATYVAPQTHVEQVIAGVWQEHMGLQQIGIHDNFFDLGGHSLLATRIITRIQKVFKVQIRLRSLFESPTVAGLAQHVEQALRSAKGIAIPPLLPVSRAQELPLSFAQQRLWFLNQFEPGGSAYHIPLAGRLDGPLVVAALQRSLHALVERHEVLHTTFQMQDGQPVQVIEPVGNVGIRLIDLSDLPPTQHTALLHSLARQEAHAPFDLAQGPLIRAMLVRVSHLEHILLLTMHHIISDGWSMKIAMRELTTLYNAYVHHLPSPLAPLAIQYADFALWQRQWLSGEVLQAQIAYWREHLHNVATLELPTDHPRPPVQTFGGARRRLQFPASVSEALKLWSQRQGITLFMTLLSAFKALLARYTGQEDIVVGTPIANRTQSDLEGLIGFFVNTLVLRTDLSGDPSFTEIVHRVQETALDAYAYQEVPFEQVVNALQLPRDVSRNPLFQVMFLLEGAFLQDRFEESVELAGITLSPLVEGEPPVKFDLTLAMVDTPQGFRAVMNYNTALFEASTIQRLLEHFQLLLEGIANQPDLRLSQLPLLNSAQEHQILHEWAMGVPPQNDPSPIDNRVGAALDVRPFPPQNDPSPIDNRVGAALDVRPFARAMVQPETTIPSAPDYLHHLVEAQERRTPDAIAVVFDNTQLTYQHLNARANRLAHSLRQLGVRTEQTVGLYLERSLETLVAVLAVLKAGAAYVPMDPIWPQERLAFLLTDAHIAVVLTQQTLREHLPSYAGPIVCLPLDNEQVNNQQNTHNLDCPLDPQNLAYLIYTSGSTGIPKGVGVSHHAIVNRLRWGQHAHPLGADDRVVQMSSLSFDIAIWELLGPLMAGARVILLPATGPQESALLGQVLEQQAVTVVHLVPSLVQVLLDEPSFLRNRQLRQVMSGGERLTRELAARFMERMHISLEHFYGPTEAAISMTWWHCGSELEERERIPIGRPITNMQGYVLDRHMQLVPPGVWGELFIGGSGLARGYVGQAGLTAERFVPHPFVGTGLAPVQPGARLYRSGDVVRLLDDGNLEYQGRNDHQVKIRGHRIELGEVEAGLRRLSGVRDGVVITREEASGQMQLVGYVVAEPGMPVLAGEPLRQELREYLPEVMIPAFLIPLDAFPLLLSGKVDRHSLPAPEAVRQEHPQGEAAPQTAFERFLSQVWEQRLGVGAIGRDEPFFAVGGDSIKAAIVINQVQERLGVQVYVVAIFDAPTIAGLARLLGQQYPEQVARAFGEESLPEEARQRSAPSEHQPINVSQVEALRRVIVPLPPRPHSEEAPTKNPEAIFVLSPPRSGSTLLRVMLAGHPGLFAPPELELLSFNTLAERQETFAGRNAFWLEGTIRALMELYQCDVDEARAMMAAYEAQGLSTQQFYRVMQQQLGSRKLVEKTPAYALDPEILKRAEADFQGARYIHLLRHPYGMIRSMEEARLDQVFFRHPHNFALRELAELIWVICQQNITAFLQTIPAERQHQIRFEDLVKQPREVLERLCAFLGIAWEEAMMSPYEGGRMTDGIHAHSKMVGDVKFHTHRQIDAKTADRWQENDQDDALGTITWQLAAQLGYAAPPSQHGTPLLSPPTTHDALPPLTRTARIAGKGLPLSFAQQRLWMVHQLQPESAAYTIPMGARLRGSLQVQALGNSIQEVVRRHETLRTTFQMEDGQPVQVVAAVESIWMRVVDLSGLSKKQREAEVRSVREKDVQRVFDLARGPLLWATLVRESQQEHILLLTMHHIVADGWSVGILMREVSELYNAYAQGRPSPLPALPIQYSDFAAWQRDWLQGAMLERQVAYWREQLRDAPPLDLPTDHPRPMTQRFRGAHLGRLMPQALNAQLKQLHQREGVTPFMTLLTAFQVLLSRYTGQTDISVGTPIANRTRAEIEGLIGFFVNTLVLRTDLSSNPTFLELLGQVRKVCLEAYAHQDVPFEKLVEVLQPERDLSRPPLFQVMFGVQQTAQTAQPATQQAMQELSLTSLGAESGSSKFEMTVTLVDTDQGLRCGIEYYTDLFEPQTIERLIDHLEVLLEGIVAHPEARLNALPLLTPTELTQLHAWNTPATPVTTERTFHQLFAQQATQAPDQVAVTLQDDCLTYATLNQRAAQLASYLHQQGISAGTLIGLCVERSLEMVIAILAILKAGSAFVPLNPSYPEQRLAFLMDDAHLSTVLTQQRLLPKLPWQPQTVICLDTDWHAIAQAERVDTMHPVSPESPAYVIYTSGSTGQPKGVLVPHRGLCNLAEAQKRAFDLQPSDRILQFAALSFDASISEIGKTLHTGATLCLAQQEELLFGQDLADLLQEQAITCVTLPPSALATLPSAALPTLTTLISAGETCSVPLMQQWAAGRHFYNAYGPTEATVCATIALCDADSSLVTIGRPLLNAQVYLLDAHLHLVPMGQVGEMYLGGEGLALGYLQRPELTAERFIPNPFSAHGGARLYKSGDLARYRADGNIEFLGRKDTQVKVRGYRIELGEIEAALNAYELVQGSAVILREMEASGEKQLVAYLVNEHLDDEKQASHDLKQYLQERLPEYMLPSWFLWLKAFPLNSSGKVDRRALPAPQSQRQMEQEQEHHLQLVETSEWRPLEEVIAGIWREVLELDEIGREENFFDLGGHSLLATQIMARVQAIVSVEVPMRGLFEAPTVMGLAAHVEHILRSQHAGAAPLLLPRPHEQELTLPLSFAQQRLWFLDQFEPGSTTYSLPLAVQLHGDLDIAALQLSLEALVQRHESLRTTFQMHDNQPIQVITPAGSFPVTLIDLTGCALNEREEQGRRLAKQEAEKPFDLEQGPVLRATLLRLESSEHALLLTMHHIVSDGWSMGIFVRELGVLYNARRAGTPSPLPALPIQYADFALWQRQWLQGEALEAQVGYWATQLADLQPLNLPTDAPRPPVQTFRGAHLGLRLPAELGGALTQLSQEKDATLFMTLLAAFQVVLSRYSGQTDISVGTPTANRSRTEIEGLIGFFVSTLVLRSDLAGDPTFLELLGRVRETCIEAYAHQDVPFEKIVEVLQPERDLSRSPLFQVMFILQPSAQASQATQTQSLQNLSLSRLPERTDTTKFDLTLAVTSDEQGLRCGIAYNTDLFEESTIARLLQHWQVLLEGIVAQPERRLSELSLLSATERHLIVSAWNETRVAYPTGRCLHQLIAAQAAQCPQAIALIFEEQHLSYGELDRRSTQLAHILQRLGVGPDALVGICLQRSLDLVVGLLAILKAGGAYVPLDPDYPQERLTFMLHDSQVQIVLTTSSLLAVVRTAPCEVLCLDTVVFAEDRQEPLREVVSEDNLAYMIYTSGSTGQPKGAMNTHRAIVNRLLWMQETYQLTACDRVVQKTPYSFDVSVWEFFWPLLSGAALVIAVPGGHRDSAYLVRLLKEQAISTLHFVPSMLQQFLQEPEIEACTSLQRIICSGEALSHDLQERVFARLPVQLENLYGPTEAAVDVTVWHCDRESTRQTVPIGRPIANMRVYLLDQHLQPVLIGAPGEIYLAGVGLARGYWHRADRTAESFLPDPLSAEIGQRLYRTGDIGRYRPDGSIEYLGRGDQQVKLRGFRIELQEIEAVLRQHPGVRENVVTLWEPQRGDQRLVAYIVAREGISIENVRTFVQEKLPEYMVPAHMVLMETLPLTSSGKVDRRALPAPTISSSETEEMLSGRTPIEELLMSTWAELLAIKQVGIHDNFFALGGHSLLATQLISRIRASMQVELPVQSLFEAPTVAGLAKRIERALRSEQGIEMPPLLPVSREQDLPLSFAQQRLWFLDQLQPESTAYNIPLAVQLRGTLDIAALRHSLRELTRRHEVLRTTFHMEGQQTVQVIGPVQNPLRLIVLHNLATAQQEAQAQLLVQQETQQPFDLTHGPLLRAALLEINDHEHILLLTMHHIISDGWSMSVLMREIGALYNAFAQGKPSPLPALPIQYADFAVWQRDWLQGAVLEAQLHYWTQQLRDTTPLDLPTDYPRPLTQRFQGAHMRRVLPPALNAQLKQLHQREGVTPFMTLLTAFQVLLSRYTGQTDISVGTPIANRTHAEIEGLIGFFVNTLVLRTDLAGNPSFLEVLRQVRKVCLDAYTHQDVPFEKLVEVLQPERDLSRPPLFQVMFGVQQTAQTIQPQPLQDLALSSLGRESGTSKFEMTVTLADTEEGLHCSVEYNTDLFAPATIEHLIGHLQVLLEGIVAHPEQPICDLPLLTPAESVQLLHAWNTPWTPISTERTFHQLVARQVAQLPDTVIVTLQDDCLTYAALNQRANQLAWYLYQQGVLPGTLIGLCVERSLEMVIAILGILKAGATFVPLNPSYPEQRLAFLMDDARLSIVLTQQRLLPKLPWQPQTVICLDTDWQTIAQAERVDTLNPTYPESPAYVIYTSGSTGQPKGVLVPHRGLCNLVEAQKYIFNLQSGDRILQFAALSFDASVWEIAAALSTGATLCLAQQEELLFGQDLADLLQEQAITCVTLPPSALAALPSVPLPTLTTIISAGETCPAPLIQQWAAGRHFYNAYGPTEATVCATAALCQVTTPAGTIGRPLLNAQVYLLDAHLHLVPMGKVGEMYLGGEGLALGYLQRPELTAERFVPNPFSEHGGARLYKSGDLARYRANGSIEFLGRVDSQVKIRGYRIELGEIEAALNAYELVQGSAVILREMEASGEKQLVAYLVNEHLDDEKQASHDLKQYLQERLPEYMVPAWFLWLKAFPLNSSGKVDRRALPAPQSQRQMEQEQEQEHHLQLVETGAWNPLEEVIAGIWREVLELDEIGREENFFDLGGHSLLATQIMARVQAIVSVEVPMRGLFEAPTLARLAAYVEHIVRSQHAGAAPPLVPRHHEHELMLPLSFAQQRLWFLDQFEPGSAAYNLPLAVQLHGDLDIAALQWSLEALTMRHESLRTTFQMHDNQPIQVITPAGIFPVLLIDLTGCAINEREQQGRRLAKQEAEKPFDLEHGPILRATLLRLEHHEHALLLTMHHIVSDGWSMGIFVHELGVLYNARRTGTPSPLPALPIQYADFALWQRQWLQGETLEAQVGYWAKQLADLQPLNLPTDAPRPPVQTFRGAHLGLRLPAELGGALTQLSQEKDATLFMTLLAAFQVVLSRYSGQTDISVGTPTANRSRTEIEGLIGFFVSTLVLRSDLAGDPTFLELLGRVRETCIEAYAHQDVPFEKIVEVLQPERDLSRSPLFQVMFMLQPSTQATQAQATRTQSLQSLSLSRLPERTDTTKFDLTLSVSSDAQGLRCGIAYNTDLFEESTIARLLHHWQVLLEGIVAQPERRLSELSLLSATERHLIVSAWNETRVTYPTGQCLHQLIAEQATQHPHTIALIFEEQHLSYGELDRRSTQLAHTLQRLGVGPDALVGICLQRSLDLVVGLLAILKAGGAYVPLDPDYPQERLTFMLLDSQVQVVLTQSSLLDVVRTAPCEVLCLDTIPFAEDILEPLREVVHEDNLAYMIYTSGSTGQPKGAMNTHRAIVNRLLWMQETYQLTACDRVVQKTPYSFDVSVWEFFWPLLSGAALVIAVPGGHRDSAYLVRLLKEQAISTLHFVPSMLQQFLQEPNVEACTSLQRIICSGEALSHDLQERVFARLPVQLENLYGPTEAAVDVTVWHCERESTRQTVPIGRPIANMRVYLLDQHLQPVLIGAPGEIYLAGVGLARGYWHRADRTAESFLPDPLSAEEGARLYRTGDIGRYRPDGSIEYLGRGDQQVKLRGFRIELQEIEAVLRQHPAIRENVVTLWEPQRGDQRLVAYIVGQEGVSSENVRTFVQEKLPEYMVPAHVVLMETLPLTSNGKVDRRALPAPTISRSEDEEMLSGRTPIEELLMSTWAELLAIKQVGIHDNFFALGGHSLLATQLISRIRASMQVELPVQSLFEAPTVAGLAKRIERALRSEQGIEMPPLLPVSREQDLPLSFAQQRLWFLDQLQPGNTAYNIPQAVHISGALDTTALEKSIEALVLRHEVLRTTFHIKDDQPVQVIRAGGAFHLPLIELGDLPLEQYKEEARRLARQEAQRPFDLARGPLLRVMLLRLQQDEYVLLLNMHHIISDAWSISVFIRELSILYAAYKAKQPSPLPALPIQYADFAAWQRQWLQGATLQALLDYWTRQLKGVTPLELPTDHPRPSVQSYRGGSHTFALPSDLSEALIALSQNEGVTPFMTLLAAFQTLLYQYTERTDIVVGTDIANRTHVEIETLIGFFINLLVLRTDLSGAPSFREVLRRVRDMTLGAYMHQDAPFEMLVEKLQPTHVMDRMPLVQVLFVFQNVPQANGSLQDVALRPFASGVTTAKFDIALFMQESARGLQGAFTYSADLFDESTIATMVRRFEALLQRIVAQPDTSIELFERYTQAEKAQRALEKKGQRKQLRISRGERISLSETDLPDARNTQ